MSLLSFMLRTVLVSISVGLRMIPVLAVTSYSIYMLLIVFGEHPLALFMIGIILYMPLLMFLYLCAVRAGLASLRATTAPSFKKLALGSLRILRFHFMINNLVFSIVGLGGMGALIWLTSPEVITILTSDFDRSLLLNLMGLVQTFAAIPAAILVFPALAIAISAGLVGTSLAATAAWVAERGPEHDLIWGMTGQFAHIFAVAFAFLVIPTGLFVLFLGGPMASIWGVVFLPTHLLIGIHFYFLWVICLIAAAMAVAYVKHQRDLDAQRAREEEEMMGASYDATDLRALRLARQQSQTLTFE